MKGFADRVSESVAGGPVGQAVPPHATREAGTVHREHAQQPGAGFLGADHVLHAVDRGDVPHLGVAAHPVPCRLGGRVVGRQIAVHHLHGKVGIHEADLGGGPGGHLVGVPAPAHVQVGLSVGLAQDHRELGHADQGQGVHEIDDLARRPFAFGLGADHEAITSRRIATSHTPSGTAAVRVACDEHPEYISTKRAQHWADKIHPVQHHHAHVVACMAENQIQHQVLGLSWDGTGYGRDRTVWGGEFLLADYKDFTRVGRFKPFSLIGGEKAIKEPRRAGLSVLLELSSNASKEFPDLALFKAITAKEYQIFDRMRKAQLNSPLTSSVGRLFDALASLLGITQYTSYEGQAAMALEYLCDGVISDEHYPVDYISGEHITTIDWRPMFKEIIMDIRKPIDKHLISVKFHNSLIEASLPLIKQTQKDTVILTGGCFQNKYLSERMIGRLKEEELTPVWHHKIPPNDGGISLGQAVSASACLSSNNTELT